MAPPAPPRPPTKRGKKQIADENTDLAKEIREELGIETEEAAASESVEDRSSPEEPAESEILSVYDEPRVEEPLKIVLDNCPICGRPKDESANLCDYCQESEQLESEPEEADGALDAGYVDTSEAQELDLPKIGGIAVIISGFLGIIYGLFTTAGISGSVPTSVVCFTSLMLIFGFAAVIGGYFALEHKNAIYAIIGAVCGILSVGYYIGAFIAIIGLALFIKSYKEFEVREVNLRLK